MNYTEFLETKKHSSIDYGIKAIWYPDGMFDYQKYVTELTIKKGRYANFLDTGTGKTLIELTTAFNYVKSTNKPVLIITPLAVADQHLREAEKFGIDDVERPCAGVIRSCNAADDLARSRSQLAYGDRRVDCAIERLP